MFAALTAPSNGSCGKPAPIWVVIYFCIGPINQELYCGATASNCETEYRLSFGCMLAFLNHSSAACFFIVSVGIS